MNWSVWNYMNIIVNVLHMFLMLSPSMSTTLLDTKQAFLMNLIILTITLLLDWSMSVVRVILPCMLGLLHPCRLLCQKLCLSFVWCVPNLVGLIPFNLELTLTFLSLWSVGTSHTHFLTHCISHTLATHRVILLASVRHRGQGITLRTVIGAATPNYLRYNWDLLQGRSPWHVGNSSTVNMPLLIGISR